MKILIPVLFLLFLLAQCKDKNDPKPLLGLESIAGQWRGTEVSYQRGDSTVTELHNENLLIRYDGVMLHDGYDSCCPTRNYKVNGIPFKVEPKEQVPYNTGCMLVDCRSCDLLEITQQAEVMTIISCSDAVYKYVRVK